MILAQVPLQVVGITKGGANTVWAGVVSALLVYRVHVSLQAARLSKCAITVRAGVIATLIVYGAGMPRQVR